VNSKRTLLAVLIGSSLLISSPTFAVNFESGTNLGTCVDLNGTASTCTTADGITIQSGVAEGNLFTEEFRGVTGLGITGGLPGEVDEGEHLFLNRSNRAVWGNLQFSRLFGGSSGDTGQEFVDVQTSFDFLRGRLVLDAGDRSATWTVFDNDIPVFTTAALALDPFPGAGLFEVSNPFRGVALTGLRLDADAPTGFSNDFAFVGVTVIPVPEPSSALLLALAIPGVIAIRRGHRRQTRAG
jgi:hypothetical protein